MWGQIAGMMGGMMGGGGKGGMGGTDAKPDTGPQVKDIAKPTQAAAPTSGGNIPADKPARQAPAQQAAPKQAPQKSEPALATRQDTNKKLAMSSASDDMNSKGGVSLGGMF